MGFATRTILILLLMLLPLAARAYGQEVPPAAETAVEATPGVEEPPAAAADGSPEKPAPAEESPALSSYEVRNQFSRVLRQSPPELARILVLDPGLLSNEGFLADYPQLSEFVAAHPEVRRNPRFYLGEFAAPERRTSAIDEIFEGISIFATIGLIAFAAGWLIRTIIEQRRWNRLSRTQAEVHNKILDRFGTSEELLAYVRTPAGTKFLESAPIPLRSEKASPNAPMTRIMWSLQLGVIVGAGALGMLLVSLRFDEETAQGLFALGAIAFCVGAGFIGSAFVSLAFSRRFGLWQDQGSAPADPADDGGLVR